MGGENLAPSLKEAIRLLVGISTTDFIKTLKTLVLDKKHREYFDSKVMACLQDIGRSKSAKHLSNNIKMYALAKDRKGNREVYLRISDIHFAHGYEMKDKSIFFN